MLGEQDTIAAIATARGVGALSVVRISGPSTGRIVASCLVAPSYDPTQTHRATHGLWVNPQSKDPVDEVVLLNFAEGRGYTGEVSAEVICHGGAQVSELILRSVLLAGARLARPGEFTFRAVMNQKMDLARAEGVLELIHAKSPRAAALALQQVRGALSEKLIRIEDKLIFILAHLEASIDFTTEDIQPVNFGEMKRLVSETLSEIENLLEGYVAARVVSRGLRVALVGRPNVGKSSLLNQILGRDRSIVAELPGTTRDTVEEETLIDGNLFRFVDTAGMRAFGPEEKSAEAQIEQRGIARTLDEMKTADLVVYVVESSSGLNNEDVEKIKNCPSAQTLICFNKADLRDIQSQEELSRFGLKDFPHVKTSALESSGVQSLKEAVRSMASAASDSETTALLSSQRQREALLAASGALRRSEELLGEHNSPELVAFELKDAVLHVQNILGKNVGDDVMDRVFKEFCIGK